MKKNLLFLILFGVFIQIFLSCKREESLPPVITMEKPLSGSLFEVGDSIFFQCRITSETTIEYVEIAIYSNSGPTSGTSLFYRPSGLSAVISGYYPIDDLTLVSGEYYLHCNVKSDGKISTGSVKIRINGIPPKPLGLIAISKVSSLSTNIYHIDSTGNPQLWTTIYGDFFDARIDNLYQQLYFFPLKNGEMQAIDLYTKRTKWCLSPGSSPSQQWFRGIELIDNRLYVGDYGSNITVYSHDKSILQVMEALPFYTAKHFLRINSFTLYYQKPLRSGDHNRILVYNMGMNLVQNMIFDHELIKWYEKDDNTVYLFYNTENGFEIAYLSYYMAGINVLRTINGQTLNDVEQLSDGQFLLATQEGIWSYRPFSGHGITMLNAKGNVTVLEKNENLTHVAAVSGRELFFIEMPLGNTINSVMLPYEIEKIFWHMDK